ncbi:MAG: DUF805 domain-containing protein [Aureisphaera sp.]
MIIEKQEADYNMLDWWKKVFIKNYANFEGRARRSEYWYYVLVNILIMIIPIVLMFTGIGTYDGDSPLYYIGLALVVLFGLASFIPSIAVAVRRLHDTGKSGWWYLIGIIPVVSYIGGIVLFVFYCIDGDKGPNQYGPDPKGNNDTEIDQIGIE